MILVGFPMDAGRLLQCILWPRVGYRQATLAAVFAGFVCCVVLGIFAMWQNEMIALALCLFIFIVVQEPVDDPGDRRRGRPVRLRLLAGLHEPGARRAAGAARAPAELVAALAATAGGEKDAARTGEPRGRGAAAWTSCWRRFSARARQR